MNDVELKAMNGWLCLVVVALNFCHSLGGLAKDFLALNGPPTLIEHRALVNLAHEVRTFLSENAGVVKS
eukprot:7733639-Karenia_brevis.AAC.2